MGKDAWEIAISEDTTGSKFTEDGTSVECKPCSERLGLTSGSVLVKSRRAFDPYRWREHLQTQAHKKSVAPLPHGGVAAAAAIGRQGNLVQHFSYSQTTVRHRSEKKRPAGGTSNTNDDQERQCPASKKLAGRRTKTTATTTTTTTTPGQCLGLVPSSKNYQPELAVYAKYCVVTPTSSYCLRQDKDHWLVVSKRCKVTGGQPQAPHGQVCCEECALLHSKWAGIQKIVSKQYTKFQRVNDALVIANKYLTFKRVNRALNRKLEDETIGYLKGLIATEDLYLSEEGKALKAQCSSALGFYNSALKLKEQIYAAAARSKNKGGSRPSSTITTGATTTSVLAPSTIHQDLSPPPQQQQQEELLEPPTLKNDGISMNKNHLPRTKAVEEIYETARKSQHVVLASSAATGKTSLLQLLEQRVAEDPTAHVVLINMNGELTAKSLLEQLKFEGIDYESRSLLRQVKNTWLLLDDAQNALDPKFDPFWQFVVKNVAGAGVEDELKVVIATTDNLSTPESSADFRGLEHIYSPVSKEEATTLFVMHTEGWGYHTWQAFRETLLNLGQCTEQPRGYHIGVIMAGIRMLSDMRKPSPATMTEDRALLALRKEHFTGSLDRCFKLPCDLLHERFKARLLDVVTGDHQEDDIFVDDPSLQTAIRAGLVTQGGKFSNMAAMWYYNRRCFPNRATKAPDRLDDLITSAVGLISSKGLRETQVQGFPTGAALYYLFNEAMSLVLPLHEAVIPELNTVVDNPPADSNVTGNIDFYVPGKLNWYLELLRYGDKIGENGKHLDPVSTDDCRKADMNDYIVVDCRGPMVGEGYQPSQSRCTLYFSEDYQFCWCQMRMEPPFRIELAN